MKNINKKTIILIHDADFWSNHGISGTKLQGEARSLRSGQFYGEWFKIRTADRCGEHYPANMSVNHGWNVQLRCHDLSADLWGLDLQCQHFLEGYPFKNTPFHQSSSIAMWTARMLRTRLWSSTPWIFSIPAMWTASAWFLRIRILRDWPPGSGNRPKTSSAWGKAPTPSAFIDAAKI